MTSPITEGSGFPKDYHDFMRSLADHRYLMTTDRERKASPNPFNRINNCVRQVLQTIAFFGQNVLPPQENFALIKDLSIKALVAQERTAADYFANRGEILPLCYSCGYGRWVYAALKPQSKVSLSKIMNFDVGSPAIVLDREQLRKNLLRPFWNPFAAAKLRENRETRKEAAANMEGFMKFGSPFLRDCLEEEYHRRQERKRTWPWSKPATYNPPK